MILLSIIKLKTLGEFSFEIAWSDGIIQYFELNEIQKSCPCARCALKTVNTGHTPTLSPQTSDLVSGPITVTASSIRSIGNYAIQIQFRSGCSSGIYTFSLLRSLGKSSALSLEDR